MCVSLVFWKRAICTEHWKAWKILKTVYGDAVSFKEASSADEAESDPGEQPDPGEAPDWSGDADVNAAPGI